MDAGLLLVIGIGVLLVIVIAFIVVNESNKRSDQDALENTADKYIREQNARNEALAREMELDPDEIRKWIDETYQAECLVPPPCPGLTVVNEETGCCELTDEEITKFQQAMKITQSIMYELAIGYAFGKVVGYAYTATKQGAKITRSALRRVSGSAGRVAARGATKVTVRTSAKYGLRFVTRAAAKVGLGPAGLAALMMELVSFGLDMADPFGFNSYRSNEVSKNMRNAYEVEVQKSTMEGSLDDRTDFPLTFPLSLAYPEHNDGFFEAYLARFTGDAMELIPEDKLANFFVLSFLSEETVRDEGILTEEQIQDASDAFAEAFEMLDAVKRVERDQFIYSYYKDKGLESKIERVPFMSTARRYGVTLSKEGCDDYNTRMEPLHEKYAAITDRYGEDEKCLERLSSAACEQRLEELVDTTATADGAIYIVDPQKCHWDENEGENGTCIDVGAEKYPKGGYAPLVALYTDTYRVVDPLNPGEKSTPNVLEKKLPRKCALAAPLGSVVEHCLKFEKINKNFSGVTFNYETGYCDYTSQFCKAYAMKYVESKNDCEDLPGMNFAESIFGTTVSRFTVVVANKAEDFFKDVEDCIASGFTNC